MRNIADRTLETFDGGPEFEGVDPVVDSGSADGVLSHFLMSVLLNFTESEMRHGQQSVMMLCLARQREALGMLHRHLWLLHDVFSQ